MQGMRTLASVAVAILLMGCPQSGKELIENDISVDIQTLPDSRADLAGPADMAPDETPPPDSAQDGELEPADVAPELTADIPADIPIDVEVEIPGGCCLTEDDCQNEQVCVMTDGESDFGRCLEHPMLYRWPPGPCWTTEDCNDGHECVGAKPGSCDNLIEEPAPGACLLPGCCLTDMHCDPGFRCDQALSSCVPIPGEDQCWYDDDCAVGQACVSEYLCPCASQDSYSCDPCKMMCTMPDTMGTCVDMVAVGCCLTDEDCNPDSFPDDYTHLCVGFGLGAEPDYGVCMLDPAVGPQYLGPQYCWDDSECGDGKYCHGLAICGCLLDCDMAFEGPGFCAPEGEECVAIQEDWVQETCNAASLVVFDGDACTATCPGCCWCGPFCDFTFSSFQECEAACGASNQNVDPACPADGAGCGKAWGNVIIWAEGGGDPLPPLDPMPYADVHVQAEKGDGTKVSADTGPDGYYELTLSPGKWTLTATPPNNDEPDFVFPSQIQVDIDIQADAEYVNNFEFFWEGDTVDKPNIYLYPQVTTQVSVELQFQKGNFLVVSDPDYGSGWNVTVEPDGLIDGKYGFLFYEATVGTGFQMDKGHNVSVDDLESWLLSALPAYGLNETETKDFVDFWCYNLPLAQWYRFYPQYEVIVAQQIGLSIVPKPDSLLRLWFVITPADEPANLAEPDIVPFNRQGFTAVEWGVVVGG